MIGVRQPPGEPRILDWAGGICAPGVVGEPLLNGFRHVPEEFLA
jgi:hypothetical protein